MIFASDLDRTLIYSKKFLPTQEKTILVETLEGREISYMTEKAFTLLQDFSKKGIFIPVTTRTEAQYKRITPICKLANYAITTNGAKILINNEEDISWKEHIQETIQKESIKAQEILEKIEELPQEWVKRTHCAEDIFYYSIIDEQNTPQKELQQFSLWAKEHNWQVSLQGRKLYYIPNCVSKKNALEYLHKKMQCDILATAGDSLLDIPLLRYHSYSFAPKHGEIYLQRKQINTQGIQFIKEGISAAEIMLTSIIKKMEEKHV